MTLRRLYLYLVSAAALGTLATGLSLLGMTVLLFVFNDPSADSMRPAAASLSAMTIVALLVWGVHYWFARRYALRDPVERASAIRRLYIYWACLVMSIGAAFALAVTLSRVLHPVLEGGSFDRLSASQSAWTTAVLLALWAFHFRVASRDRAAVGEQGAAATLRRLYMYPALLFGLFMMLAGASYLIQLAWFNAHGLLGYPVLSDATGGLLGGLALLGFHARVLAVDAGTRPAKAEAIVEAPAAPAPQAPVVSEPEAVAPVPLQPSVSETARRFVLTVEGASDDDIHTALAGLPPQASYRLVPSYTTE